MENKFNYLLKNTGLIFVGNFSSKVLVFLLVPLYTSVLSTEEYGCYDILYTSIQFLMPLLTVNVSDAVLRFSFNNSFYEQKRVFTIGMKYLFLACLALIFGLVIILVWFDTEIIHEFWYLFFILFFSCSINQMLTQFSRGLDDVLGTAIAGVLGTIAMLLFNIYFLLILKLGIKGYFYANILGCLCPTLYLFVRNKMYRYIRFSAFFLFDSYEKVILKYCYPLIFNSLGWHINNLSDRYIVTLYCGLSTNGIYSVSYKIPAILNAVQVIFIQAWQLSAIKESESDNKDIFYTKVFCGCQSIMILLCSSLIIATRFMAKLLFANEFYNAWVCVPTLLLYVVFNTLSGVVGGIFSATRDTVSCAKTAIVGSIVNIILNILFVNCWGMIGAACATVISSIVIVLLRIMYSSRYVKLNLNYKVYLMEYFILVLQVISMTNITENYVFLIQFILWFVLVVFNYFELKRIAK